MKTRRSVQAAAAGFALLMALRRVQHYRPAMGQGARIRPNIEIADISEGVQPDPAAVALLPASYKEKGELTVAMDLHYPPTTFLADDSTTPIGLNPDIARLVAKKLDSAEVRQHSFDTIIPGIKGSPITTSPPPPCPPRRAAQGPGHDRLFLLQRRAVGGRCRRQPTGPEQ